MAKMPETPDPGASPKGQKPCPICGKPALASERPFCSKRCADVDLFRWLGGAYAIPGPPATEEEQTAAKPAEE